MNERTNAEFEYSVIGAICMDSGIIQKIAPLVAPSDFTIAVCGKIFEAALEAVSRGRPFDAVYAAEAAAEMEAPAPREFIAECMDWCPTLTNAELHAREIHKHARLRNLRAEIDEALFGAKLGQGDPDDIAADVAELCQNFLVRDRPGRYVPLVEALGTVYDRATSQDQTEQRIDTGMLKLDSILKGIGPKDLVLIGARPAVGKSAFALRIGCYAARCYGTVLMYSLEMDAAECAERLAADYSSIKMDQLIDGDIKEKTDIDKLCGACSRLGDLPLMIFDTPKVTPAAIRRDVHMFKNVRLIIVDFISLMGSDKKFRENRNLELGQISRDLKLLAMDLSIPIVALSQLNRSKSETIEPNLSDLRDSGELEQNANKVMFLWQLEDYGSGVKDIGVSVAKNRRGRLGAVQMRFDGNYMRFSELGYLERRSKEPEPVKSRYGGGVLD